MRSSISVPSTDDPASSRNIGSRCGLVARAVPLKASANTRSGGRIVVDSHPSTTHSCWSPVERSHTRTPTTTMYATLHAALRSQLQRQSRPSAGTMTHA